MSALYEINRWKEHVLTCIQTVQALYEMKGKVNSLYPEDGKCQNLSSERSSGVGGGDSFKSQSISDFDAILLGFEDCRD